MKRYVRADEKAFSAFAEVERKPTAITGDVERLEKLFRKRDQLYEQYFGKRQAHNVTRLLRVVGVQLPGFHIV